MPPDYARIFAFDNFTRTQKHVLAKIAELDGGTKDCALVGSYVRLSVTNVPTDIASKLCDPSRRIPVVVSGLLQHESKISVLHFRYSSCTKQQISFTPIFWQYGICSQETGGEESLTAINS